MARTVLCHVTLTFPYDEMVKDHLPRGDMMNHKEIVHSANIIRLLVSINRAEKIVANEKYINVLKKQEPSMLTMM